ncbi:MAG: MFS transporter [Chloroflexi bacterium]|nr:MFS transporter [Chloroflexota bacterium]
MTVLGAYRRLLGNRPLSRLLLGEFVSSIGDWLYLVALLIVIYDRGATIAVLGIVGAARVLPYIFLSIPAGIVADRFDRRLVLLVTDLARAAVMVVLAYLVATEGSLLAIIALTILATCFSAFFGPAIGSYLPSLVRDESELGPANSAYASLDNLAFIIGPAIAGLLIATGGLALAFLLNALTFAFVAVMLWFLPPSRAGAGSTVGDALPEATTSAADGGPARPSSLRAVLRDPRVARPLAGLALVQMAGGFAFGGLGVLTVVIAVDVLQAGEQGTGALNAAIGVGGLLGALASGALVLRRRLGPPLLAGGVLLGLGLVVLGATQAAAVALAAMSVAAIGIGLVEIVATTLFQRVVPDQARGRVLGALETVSVTVYAAGSLLVPVLAGIAGVGAVLVGCGIVVVAATVLGLLVIGRPATTTSGIDPFRARLGQSELFAGLPAARLEAAMRALHVVEAPIGHVIIRQGDPADRFYLIANGSVDVTQTDEQGAPRQLRTMGPGSVFGEIGLLTGAPRSATVTAGQATTLLALDGDDFLELVGAGPGLTSRLLDLHRGAPTPAR